MCVFVCVCVCSRAHACTHVRARVHTQASVRTHTHVCVPAFAHVCESVWLGGGGGERGECVYAEERRMNGGWVNGVRVCVRANVSV